MTAPRTPSEPATLVSPVIDYEPPPLGITAPLNVAGQAAPALNVAGQAAPALNVAGQAAPCPSPTPAAMRRRTVRPLRLASHAAVREPIPPRAAVVFADSALRRVLEVIDRRRPAAQLRPLLAPALIDTVIAMTRSSHIATATLRRLRVRMIDCADVGAPHVRDQEMQAEVFGTYTRGPRVRAIAARIALNGDRWRIVALQMG